MRPPFAVRLLLIRAATREPGAEDRCLSGRTYANISRAARNLAARRSPRHFRAERDGWDHDRLPLGRGRDRRRGRNVREAVSERKTKHADLQEFWRYLEMELLPVCCPR